MEKITGALKSAANSFVALAPAAAIMARTGKAYVDSRSARQSNELMQGQISVERSLAEARASRDEAERSRRLTASMSSQMALASARGIDLTSYSGVMEGDRQEYQRDVDAIRINRLTRMSQLDFMGNDAMRMAQSQTRNAWLTAASGNAGTLFEMYRREPTKRGAA
jgi:hypothetical protein